jgi:hypothetical protein
LRPTSQRSLASSTTQAPAEQRSAAFGKLDSSLSRLVQEPLRDKGEMRVWELALDGIRALSVEALGPSALRIRGAYYLLEERAHRLVLLDAEF